MSKYLIPLHRLHRSALRPGPRCVGNKARGLWFLQRSGFAVPKTLVCTWEAYRHWAQADFSVLDDLRDELTRALGAEVPDAPHQKGARFAVRSSANVEDRGAHSFAGQFHTSLSVPRPDLVPAIEAIWKHVRDADLAAYLGQVGLSEAQIEMAVLIQEMVSPVVSGVAFSANPVTGMSELIVEAVPGSGESLVQGGATPQRWVDKWGVWIETPADDDASIPTWLVAQVVEQTRAIARAYGKPVDLEWVWDGETIYWVQLREITTLAIDVYSNDISKEVFPGLIKPLIWSVNVPLVNSAWVQLLTELIGPNEIEPNDLAARFYSRAYFNMGAVGRILELLGFPRESLELLMGFEITGPAKPSFRPTAKTLRFVPRMLIAALRKLAFGRRIEAFLPEARREYDLLAAHPLPEMSEPELVQHVDRLDALTRKAAYYNIVTRLLMQIYDALFQRAAGRALSRSKARAVELDLSVDLPELELYDPSSHLVALHNQYDSLGASVRAIVKEEGYAALDKLGARSFRASLDRFIAQFGHLSDSGTDFSAVPWRETPDLVLEMVRHYPGSVPGKAASRLEDLDLPPLSKALLRPLYRRARRFRVYREAVSSLYTYGYGLFRDVFLALGARFVERGLLDAVDGDRPGEDVFYLDVAEVRALAQEAAGRSGLQHLVEQRKQELAAHRDLVPPGILYGGEEPDLQADAADTWSGTPTSRGRYRGPVRVVRGIQDFFKVQPGDVLVIPYADVGWTPLFARAGAVIAESGGMLSHSSIVAREYDIPAVVSVPNVGRLADDTVVTVDGYRGAITVHQV